MQKFSILLVDDERMIAEGIRIILESAGYDWSIAGIAEDGEEGLKAVHELDPDLVITDVKMPCMDGLEMIERLTSEGCRQKFIILSGYQEFEYARKALVLGVCDYVCKPIEEEEIIRAVQTVQEKMDEEKRQLESMMNRDRTEPDPGEGDETIDRMRRYIRENYAGELTLADLAAHFYMNASYVSQLFRKKTGMTFQNYLTGIRIREARRLLTQTSRMVYEISEQVGYSDTVYFSRVFEKVTGCRPSEYRKRNEKEK